MFLDPWYFVIIGPAFLLAFWAQGRVLRGVRKSEPRRR